jgi:hypothetical protein
VVTPAFHLISAAPVAGCGRLAALAAADVEIDGEPVRLSGIQIVVQADGVAEARAPIFAHPRSGQWLTGLALPSGLAAAALAACQGSAPAHAVDA